MSTRTDRTIEVLPIRIAACRIMNGERQQDVAQKAGVTSAVISHWECGQRAPSVGNLKILALALGVSADYLLGLPDNLRRSIESPDTAKVADSGNSID